MNHIIPKVLFIYKILLYVPMIKICWLGQYNIQIKNILEDERFWMVKLFHDFPELYPRIEKLKNIKCAISWEIFYKFLYRNQSLEAILRYYQILERFDFGNIGDDENYPFYSEIEILKSKGPRPLPYLWSVYHSEQLIDPEGIYKKVLRFRVLRNQKCVLCMIGSKQKISSKNISALKSDLLDILKIHY